MKQILTPNDINNIIKKLIFDDNLWNSLEYNGKSYIFTTDNGFKFNTDELEYNGKFLCIADDKYMFKKLDSSLYSPIEENELAKNILLLDSINLDEAINIIYGRLEQLKLTLFNNILQCIISNKYKISLDRNNMPCVLIDNYNCYVTLSHDNTYTYMTIYKYLKEDCFLFMFMLNNIIDDYIINEALEKFKIN